MYQMGSCFIIYCHTHIPSGRRYVGQTKQSASQRWADHVRESNRESAGYFSRSIKKYGKDEFTQEILEKCGSQEEANEAEKKWIEFYQTNDPSRGFNLMIGGQHGETLYESVPDNHPWKITKLASDRLNEIKNSGKKVSFGEYVKLVRMSKGISIRGIARELQINATYISKVEREEMPPPAEDVITRLATVLELDKDDLMIMAGRIPSDILEAITEDKDKQREFVRLIRTLRHGPAEAIEQVTRHVKDGKW